MHEVMLPRPSRRPRFAPLTALIAAALTLGSCGLFGAEGPVRVAIIGAVNGGANPRFGPLTPGDALLLDATAQGLVAFDSDGQIEPGLAERWTVTGDGLSYIFRIRAAKWSDGRPVEAKAIADALASQLSGDSANPMRLNFPEVSAIKAMTATVIEIRLNTPQSHLLDLLAQPAMAVPSRGHGWGPMRKKREGRQYFLTPVPDPLAEDPEAAEDAAADPANMVDVIARSAPRALARFKNGYADAVLGGRFHDFPHYVASEVPRSRLAVDPAPGLFGFAIVNASGFLANDENRNALSMALRRERMLDAFGLQEWQSEYALRPTRFVRNRAVQPIIPDWAEFDEASRRARAKRAVDAYKATGRAIDPVRIAMPDGPGARILYAYIAADWNSIGVPTRRVQLGSPADLRLIDEVAPYDDPIWPLRRLSCAYGLPCHRPADAKLAAASKVSDPVERNRLIGEAETDMARYVPFIPVASPLRWSVVSERLSGFKPNSRSLHPLNRLMSPPT
jgi:peptide/nickel transport system substrate-binding protein